MGLLDMLTNFLAGNEGAPVSVDGDFKRLAEWNSSFSRRSRMRQTWHNRSNCKCGNCTQEYLTILHDFTPIRVKAGTSH
jgi:hypothetical protein